LDPLNQDERRVERDGGNGGVTPLRRLGEDLIAEVGGGGAISREFDDVQEWSGGIGGVEVRGG